MPRIAAEIDAVTSPSWISLIRAPAARISSIRSWWRGRSSTSVVMSFALRPNASATAAMFSAIGRIRSIRPFARGPTAIRRMYMSGSRRSSRADGEHRHRPGAAARNDAAALERVDCKIECLAARADVGPGRERRPIVRSDHDRSGDRELREPGHHRAFGGLPGRRLVVSSEPARSCQRSPLGRLGEEHAGAGRQRCLAHRAPCATRWACSRTRSMTASTAFTCELFSITGTSHRTARSSRYSWIIRISGSPAM